MAGNFRWLKVLKGFVPAALVFVVCSPGELVAHAVDLEDGFELKDVDTIDPTSDKAPAQQQFV